jgi:hypothetical protein
MTVAACVNILIGVKPTSFATTYAVTGQRANAEANSKLWL